jgi:Zn-dependent protease with chaperone function
MFAVRGIVVAFSVFVLVYGVLSVGVCFGWRSVWRKSRRRSARRADLLFSWRMFPLVTAALVTAAFTVPSFLLLEPRAIDEPLGAIPLALGICGAGLGIFGVLNASVALRRVSRMVARWTSAAQPVDSCATVPVLRISQVAPAMNQPATIRTTVIRTSVILPTITAAGIVRPRILLSATAESMLTASELRIALNHEVAHVRRRDNLKKLLLRFVAFPGMAGLEAAWLEATEMAADDDAVSNTSEALDLAAALIKLSRLIPIESGFSDAAMLTTALLHSPAEVVNARVERLIAWSDERLESPKRFSPWYGLAAATVTVAVFAITYSRLLAHVHTATEWLVR